MKRLKPSTTFLLAAIILLQASLYSLLWAGERTTGYYLGLGGVVFDTGPMRNELTAAGYKTPRNWAYMVGGGFYARRRLVLEAELNGLIWKPREIDRYETRLEGYVGSINLGVNLLPVEMPMALYPYIGSGTGRTRLKLNQTQADFSEAVAGPVTSLTLAQRSYAFRAGVGFDFDFTGRKSAKKLLSVGFRSGFMFDVTDNNDWEGDNVAITHGPELKTTGFYAKVVIGKSRKRSWPHDHSKKCGNCPKT